VIPTAAAGTLPAALQAAAEDGGFGLAFHLEHDVERVSAKELLDQATAGAVALAGLGVRPGDAVGLIGPNEPAWAGWAFSVWSAAAVLVPLPFPQRIVDRDTVGWQIASLARAAGCRVVLAHPRFLPVVPEEVRVRWDLEALDVSGRASGQGPTPDAPAVVQFTSGSTSAPKGAVLTHRAIIACLDALKVSYEIRPGEDRYLGWLPFFHDNGLFGYLVRPIVHGCEGHVLPTERFARDPAVWFRHIGQTRATFTSGPSSAWAVALRAAGRSREGIDLAGLRLVVLAAETIQPDVVDKLADEGGRLGLAVASVAGGYGLADNTLSVSITRPGTGLRIDEVDLASLAAGTARPVGAGPGKRVASCGFPVRDVEVRVVRDGANVGEREVGEVLVRSPSLMTGYLGSEGPDPFLDGWLLTGDLGYVVDGELFVTGRVKDVIIVLGRNYAPEDLEWAAARVPGTRPGRCIAFAPPDAEGEVVLVVEANEDADVAAIPRQVQRAASDAVGLAPRQVLVVDSGTIEKTTSGKLRRRSIRDRVRGEVTPLASLR
jgi:fatty-acyl-CoA synthase